MNRFLLFAITIGLSLSSAAHSALDLKSKALLRHQRMEIAKPDNSEYTLKVKQLKNALGVPSDYALGIIRIADGYSDDDLRQEGINVLRSRYGFAFVAIPIDQVERVADLKSVRRLQLARPLSQKLKRAREATGVDKIHQGIGLEQAYTGKGVVCGIVDTGLDPNHLNFKDDEGNSRVGFLAHLTQNPYATSADDAVIQTFYDRSTVANFTSDDRSTYHGTHTMGIMAGGYRGNLKYAEANDATGAVTVTSGANPFYGVAYDADIAAACGDLMDMIIAYGVDYILQYAENEKKPCVINLSLGSNDGAHDGHGVINQFFDACAEMANAIICVSAGNEGDMKIAVNKTFTADDNELKTFITGYETTLSDNSTAYARAGSIYVYSNDTTKLSVQAVLFNTARGKVAGRYTLEPTADNQGYGKYYVSSASEQYTDDDIIDQVFGTYMSGYVGLGWDIYDEDEDYPRFYVLIDYKAINTAANANGQYALGFIINGAEGQRVDVFCDGQFSQMGNEPYPSWDDASFNGSISDLATGNSTVVVGSYNTTNEWGATDGYLYHSTYDLPVGEVTHYSSYGTLIDGRNMPLVVAPGAVIISSVNHYYDATDSSGLSAQITDDSRKDSFGWSMGTSMASPHVAGAIALWLEADPTLTVADVKEIIAETAFKDEYTALADPVQVGCGKFDAYAGLKKVLERKAANSGISNAAADIKLVVTPAGNNAFRVLLANAQSIDARVFSTQGLLVKQVAAEGNEATVDVSSLPAGCYVINVNGRHSKCVIVK